MGVGLRLPYIAVHDELSNGSVTERQQKKRFEDSINKTLGTCHIDYRQWSTLSADRPAWRCTVH